MPGHDWEEVSDLIEAQADFTAKARAILDALGQIDTAKYKSVSANKVLVALPGYAGPLDDPTKYLVLAEVTS